jgi:hypothetical protein
MPVIHYNWDLYPAMVRTNKTYDWRGYIADLRKATVVLVPSQCTATRTMEFTNRGANVVLAPIDVWEIPNYADLGNGDETVPMPKSYVLDVMRDYPWDPHRHLAQEVCNLLKIPLVRTQTTTDWNRFRWLVANARVLLSCYDEASTGGLTLLEGYAHGVPCIVCDSPRHGAVDYFGDRATYFKHTEPFNSLAWNLDQQWRYPSKHDAVEHRQWVISTYSDRVFAQQLKEVFERCAR